MIFGQLKFCGGYICGACASLLDGKNPELKGDLKKNEHISTKEKISLLTDDPGRTAEMAFHDVPVFCGDSL